jgi:hypothetical protein
MKLYICKEKPESLMIDVVAAPDAHELRSKYRVIIEVNDITGTDGQRYEAIPTLRKRTKQDQLFE